MFTDDEWKKAEAFIHQFCPTQSGRLNPTQRTTDDDLFKLYKQTSLVHEENPS